MPITTGSDALWYVVVTISTVGYGDLYPVTNAGRVVGSLLIVLGVGIFGTFTGYLANLFLAPKPPKEEVEVLETRERVAHLRELMAQQQATLDQLDKLLTDELPETPEPAHEPVPGQA